MKKIIVLSLILFGFYSAYAQDFIQELKKMTLTIDSLQKQVIKPLQDSISGLNSASVAALSKMQKQVNALEKDAVDLNKKIDIFENEIAGLNKNNVKIERDSLRKQVERLNANVAELKKQNQEKEGKIDEEQRNGEQKAKAEKENGKKEILEIMFNSYLNKKFDDLIDLSTKLSVQRDIQLVDNNAEVKFILTDLEKYFIAEELLTKKFEAAQIKAAQTQLNQINHQSVLLDKLKENIKYYKDFNAALIKTTEKIIDMDKLKVADGDTKIQKMKFQEILSELSNYIYNYDGFSNYPYLSDIVLQIIKRKQPNADADISDLLRKLL